MYFLYDTINSYSEKEYSQFYQKLNTNDKNKVNLIQHQNNKKLFLLSRILLSKLTIKHFNTNYFKLNIYYNNYNKPLTNKFYFNIAHSHNYAIVVCSNNRIGTDIEKIRKVDNKIINYFCNPKEKEYILNKKDKNKAFFTLFCLKEAYFKMIGSTIRNFSKIEFIIHNKKAYCKQNNKLTIHIYDNIPGYIFTIIEEK